MIKEYKYLAIGFWSNNNFSLSRETNSKNKKTVSDMLCKEALFNNKDYLTVLLIANGKGKDAPEVVSFWTPENFGDE